MHKVIYGPQNIEMLKNAKFLDPEQASQYMLGYWNIKLSASQIRRHCRAYLESNGQNGMRSIKPGKARAIKPEWVDEYLDERG